jgi:hypothetical protein
MTTQTTVPTTSFAIPKFAQDLIAGTIGGWAQVVVGKSRADCGVTALHLRFVTHQVTIRSSIRHYQSSYADTAFTTNLQECSWLLPVFGQGWRGKLSWISVHFQN